MKTFTRWKKIFINYIKNNLREYTLVTLLFIIGIFIGVIIINNSNDEQLQGISTYITDFIEGFKDFKNINYIGLICESVKSNMVLALILWAAGTTVIGVPIVLLVILYRGLCLGYTISIITYTLGTLKSIEFCLCSIFLQNVIFIPAIITIGVSSIKLYESIIKDKRKENIKIEIIRHTVITGIMVLILAISSLVENLVSIPILQQVL